jgi:pentatricopeptide repeat protein
VEVAVLNARTATEMESVLEAARLTERQLMPLIKEIGSSRDVQKLDWLWAWAKKQTGVKLNVFHYNAYITQLGRRRRWEDAYELYASMQKARVKPDVYTYSALISVCEKGKQWQRAVEVFEQMKAARVQPTVITYSALISACEKRRAAGGGGVRGDEGGACAAQRHRVQRCHQRI